MKRSKHKMNYKDELLEYVEEGKGNIVEFEREKGHSVDAAEKAYELTYQILANRFQNELKHYNNHEEKAYDVFVAKKNLNYLRVYIEEFLLLDKKEVEIEFYKKVQKHMRALLENLNKECLVKH